MMLRQVNNNLERITATLDMNVGECTSLGKTILDVFYSGSLLHDVIKRWRHLPPGILRHSDNIDKSEYGSYLLCTILLKFRHIFMEIWD